MRRVNTLCISSGPCTSSQLMHQVTTLGLARTPPAAQAPAAPVTLAVVAKVEPASQMAEAPEAPERPKGPAEQVEEPVEAQAAETSLSKKSRSVPKIRQTPSKEFACKQTRFKIFGKRF